IEYCIAEFREFRAKSYNARNIARNSAIGLGFLVKSNNYDRKKSFRKFLTHFKFVARANNWNESAKTMVLAPCLREKTCVLKKTLAYRGIITSLIIEDRGQERISCFAVNLDRFSQVCTTEMQDKILYTQFINATRYPFLRQTLQLEESRNNVLCLLWISSIP
ncbi:hypothetical protein V1477_019417, partial [Vespula maculifrons]